MITESSYSALIVSANEKFNQVLASIMPPEEFSCEVVGNVGEGRRMLLERDYDIVIVNTPLPDEFGVNFAIDTGDTSGCGVLLCVNAEFFDEVTDKCEDYGILTVSKPTTKAIVKQSLKLLQATRRRLSKMEKKNASFEQKPAEIKNVNRAKWLLIDVLSMSEKEAHRYIEKLAMDTRRSKADVAAEIIKEYTKP